MCRFCSSERIDRDAMARQFFRVELSWAKLLGVVLMLAPVPARLKEWVYAGFAINQLRRVQVTLRAAKIGARVGTYMKGPSRWNLPLH